MRVGPEALVGPLGAAAATVERVSDIAVAALTAEAVGAMWAIYEQSLDYAKTRTQFGQTLGSFQALQHRLVDLYMKCQLAQSMVHDATLSLVTGDRTAAASHLRFVLGVRPGYQSVRDELREIERSLR